VSNIAVSPDGNMVLSYRAGILVESMLAAGRPRLAWERHGGSVEAVAAVPGTRQVISSSSDGTLRMWGALSGENLRAITGAGLGVYCVAISSDDVPAVGCKDGMVQDFRLEQLDDHRGWVETVAFVDAVGSSAVSGGADGRIIHWNIQAGEAVGEMEHGSWLRHLAVSADGRTIYSAADDRSICVGNLATGERTERLTGQQAGINDLALLGDEGLLVSASSDTGLLVWTVQ
jgi:WD40 repeat protein